MSDRAFLAAGGVVGALGVASAAAAAHQGGAFTQTISTMLLAHAPVFVALGLSSYTNRLARIAGLIMLAGLAVFTLDLWVRDMGMARLFPLAAPIGGTAIIAGWLALALSALIKRQ